MLPAWVADMSHASINTGMQAAWVMKIKVNSARETTTTATNQGSRNNVAGMSSAPSTDAA